LCGSDLAPVRDHLRRCADREHPCFRRALDASPVSAARRLVRPVRSWWLQHAEFVAIRIGQDMPAPAVLGDGLPGENLGTQAGNPFRLRLEIARAQVEMNAVLGVLTPGHPLQEDLGAFAIGRQQRLIAACGNAVTDIPQHAGPEFRRTFQLRTVDHDNQLSARIRMGLTTHHLILHGSHGRVLAGPVETGRRTLLPRLP
jgi:hypothetical protein